MTRKLREAIFSAADKRFALIEKKVNEEARLRRIKRRRDVIAKLGLKQGSSFVLDGKKFLVEEVLRTGFVLASNDERLQKIDPIGITK